MAAFPPPTINPGDLITADFANMLVQQLIALGARVAALEGGAGPGGLVITGLTPDGVVTPIRALSELRIAGHQFRYSVSGHRVFFDSTRVLLFKPGSSDDLLIFDVPLVPALLASTTGSAAVVLRVENSLGPAVTRNITVLAPVSGAVGNVDVVWRDDVTPNPNPNPITAGATVTIAYRLRSRATDANFVIGAVVSPIDGSAEVLDASGSAIPGSAISLTTNEERAFQIRFKVPAASTGQKLSITVSASAGDIKGSDVRTTTIGTAVEPSDPSIQLSSPDFQATDDLDNPSTTASFDAATNTLLLPVAITATLTYLATFVNAGTYTVTAEPSAGLTGWTITRNPTVYKLTLGSQSEPSALLIRPQPGATAGDLTFRIAREGNAVGQTRHFHLKLI